MKILRAAVKGERDKVYDEDKLAEIDREQGRKRLTSGQVEALISISVGSQLVQDGYDALKEHAKYSGAARRLNMAVPMVHNAIKQMTSKVAGAQMITLSNNTRGVTIMLSADPVDGQCNVSYRSLSQIVSAALDQCELSCVCNREQSKRCALRKAYETVPGMKLAARQNSSDPNRCPYAGLAIELEEA